MSTHRTADRRVLVASIFVVGLCSIVYELLVSTTSSYFLGDSIRQFSITIGTYLAAMGMGSYLVRYVRQDALAAFIKVELVLGVLGALSVPLLYGYFARFGYEGFQPVMLLLVVGIGVLTGYEIPLLTRLLQPHFSGEEALSNVLTLDYVGALAATLLFPFVLLPFVGVFQSSIVFGLVNVGVAGVTAYHFRENPVRTRQLWWSGSLALLLVGGLFLSGKLLSAWQDALYRDRVVFTETTPYQTLAITRAQNDVRLYIDRVIQWSSRDEYRYHESLVHPAMHAVQTPKRVLVLGGGEGLAVREILKYPSVDSVVVVDIDPAIFHLATTHRDVLRVTERAMLDPRVRAIAEDAYVYLHASRSVFDVVVVDLPDPTTDAIARLYSVSFFRLCRRLLAPGGRVVTQATGPFHTAKAFACIGVTLEAAGLEVIPYHTYVPSFGGWGFWVGSSSVGMGVGEGLDASTQPNVSLVDMSYWSPTQWARDCAFPRDVSLAEVEPNTLNRPVLLDYYLADWRRWGGEKVVW